MMSEAPLLLTAVGDAFLAGTIQFADGRTVASDEALGMHAFDRMLPTFHNSDINFCNLEAALSAKGTLQVGRTVAFRSYPSMVEVLAKGEIDFVSLANNHSMDYGWEALSDTREILRKKGIGFAGAGATYEEARKPVIIEKKGITIGLLSYATNINTPFGFRATEDHPGVAAIRVSPFFDPPQTNKEDMEALQEDVEKWKSRVDFLILSCHWGVSDGGSQTIAMHQRGIAHLAINAGADLILGHHPHMAQAIEIYGEKLICYSLGNFVFGLGGFPRDTIVFQCRISPHKIHEAMFWPAFISKEGQPEIVPSDQGKGRDIAEKMKKLCLELNTRLIHKPGMPIIVQGMQDQEG